MRTLTHHALAKRLSHFLPEETSLRSAFILGCIEPDVNLVSHISPHDRLNGHNHPYLDKKIMRMANKLKKHPQELTWVSAYRLGILVHYLADSFTYAHNREFHGRFEDHNAYEKALHRYFQKHLPLIPNRFFIKKRQIRYQDFRKLYRSQKPTLQRDFHFILLVTSAAVNTFAKGATNRKEPPL